MSEKVSVDKDVFDELVEAHRKMLCGDAVLFKQEKNAKGNHYPYISYIGKDEALKLIAENSIRLSSVINGLTSYTSELESIRDKYKYAGVLKRLHYLFTGRL